MGVHYFVTLCWALVFAMRIAGRVPRIQMAHMQSINYIRHQIVLTAEMEIRIIESNEPVWTSNVFTIKLVAAGD